MKLYLSRHVRKWGFVDSKGEKQALVPFVRDSIEGL